MTRRSPRRVHRLVLALVAGALVLAACSSGSSSGGGGGGAAPTKQRGQHEHDRGCVRHAAGRVGHADQGRHDHLPDHRRLAADLHHADLPGRGLDGLQPRFPAPDVPAALLGERRQPTGHQLPAVARARADLLQRRQDRHDQPEPELQVVRRSRRSTRQGRARSSSTRCAPRSRRTPTTSARTPPGNFPDNITTHDGAEPAPGRAHAQQGLQPELVHRHPADPASRRCRRPRGTSPRPADRT